MTRAQPTAGFKHDYSGTAREVAPGLRMTIIIPTLQEADHIGRLITHLQRHADGRLTEILVVDAGSTDGTAEAARDAGACVITHAECSRAAQMNRGAAEAQGNVLYFVHADTLPPAEYLDNIQQALATGAPMGCFRTAFDRPHPLLKINAYLTRFDLPFVRGGDQTLFVTSDLFRATGGYDEAFVIMEEYEWLQRARRLAPFAILPEYVIVSARKYAAASYLRVNAANVCVFTLYTLGASPARLRSLYGRLLGQKTLPDH